MWFPFKYARVWSLEDYLEGLSVHYLACDCVQQLHSQAGLGSGSSEVSFRRAGDHKDDIGIQVFQLHAAISQHLQHSPDTVYHEPILRMLDVFEEWSAMILHDPVC